MLVKPFGDGLSWQVQRELVNNYFRVRSMTQLEVLQGTISELVKQEQRLRLVESCVTKIKETIVRREDDWRTEAVNKLRKIGFRTGQYKEIINESYRLLEERAGCNLNIRLENLKRRMALEGATKSAINEANYLDVIEADKRLTEIYINIVNQLYIKYVA